MKIAITGHRPNSFLISHYNLSQIEQLADDQVCILKRQYGDELIFLLGGAVGTDQMVGNSCIKHNVKFKLFLPYYPSIQAKFWKDSQKKELNRQLKKASGIHIINPNVDAEYSFDAYIKRNKLIVDSSDFVLSFWSGKRKGGTYLTISYALKQNKITLNALDNNSLILNDHLKNGWTPVFLRGENGNE